MLSLDVRVQMFKTGSYYDVSKAVLFVAERIAGGVSFAVPLR